MKSQKIISVGFCLSIKGPPRRMSSISTGERLRAAQAVYETRTKKSLANKTEPIFCSLVPSRIQSIKYCLQDPVYAEMYTRIKFMRENPEGGQHGLSALHTKADILRKKIITEQQYGPVGKFINAIQVQR